MRMPLERTRRQIALMPDPPSRSASRLTIAALIRDLTQDLEYPYTKRGMDALILRSQAILQ